MTSSEDGVWNLAIYIPERAEFLYQVKNTRRTMQPTLVYGSWFGV